jgi:tryptophan halogenase
MEMTPPPGLPELPRRPVRRVVIAGGGTAGWMVAALLAKTLGRQLQIRLVESAEIGTVGVGEATIPTLHGFHRLLGLDERELMTATSATFKLGVRFEHWHQPGQHYMHAFGLTGQDHWSAGFQHFWVKGRARGLAGDYGDYCLEQRAAQLGGFAHLPRDGMHYAYHFDASRYAQLLRRFSEALGVQRIEARIDSVQLDDAHTMIRALRLADGSEVDGDLFIDCTGFRALLIGQALQVPYEDWSHWLPCDRALAVQSAAVTEPAAYTCATAHDAGWQWRIALQHRVGNGLVYASRHMSDERARELLLSHVQGELLTRPLALKFTPGQRHASWRANCVAVGLASGFLEPIESTSIHLIQRAAIRLLQLFPAGGLSRADIAEYNRQTQAEIEHVRDFIVLHYHATQRSEPLWAGCRAMALPASLRDRIELFRETGRVFRADSELFAQNSWVQVFLGQGIVPRAHHPLADLMSDAELARFLGDIRRRIERTVAQLPPHGAYVEQYCGALAPA